MKRSMMVLLFVGVFALALPAHASVMFQLDSLTVWSTASDPGHLVIGGGLNYVPDPFELDCPGAGCPDFVFFEDLFYLDNTESSLDWDDVIPADLYLTFNFSLPETGGQTVSGTSWGYVSLVYPWPSRWLVNLTNPTVFSFDVGGSLYDLEVNISPASATFGFDETGYFDVTFTLVDCEPIPIPATVWLLASGVAGLLAFRRRSRRKA